MGCTSSTQVAPEQNSTKPASHGGPVTPRPTVAAGGTTNEQDGTTRILVTPQGSGLGSMRNAPAGGAGQSSDTPSRRASIEMTKGLFSISKGGSVTPLTTADEEEKKKFGNMSPMTDAYLVRAIRNAAGILPLFPCPYSLANRLDVPLMPEFL